MSAQPADGTPDVAARPVVEERPTIVMCPEGPMLLRGDAVIEDAEGNRHRTTRPVSAVCRCNKSATKPWCDGTHKLLPKKLRP
ncbi:CDGSH iron-sulfur domain-containing protein [Nocardioides abyssi]|uniref:CDGSH iron-sulfur domain-containing protein n=1 Tax=Nocardioides abyssi TaxID=3058370 RepID=A0ABT8EQG8_9ACTN|nr:CDGSH iron-sulfur domain-containing protein [Nocardioides abyssi]MDN4160388.1 CDGSH iron-sulfur domain-containing protein [Nocardioides abyssi]